MKVGMSKETGKRAASRRKIMHGAKCLFEKKGIENVTFSDIAEEVDMCRTTVFNHFSNTDELMLGIFQQEIEDVENHCETAEEKGIKLIILLFDKLVEDTVYYPVLTTKLINNTILSKEKEKSISKVERIIDENLELENYSNRKELIILIMGAYYGLVNHYHLNNLEFENKKMQEEFHQLINMILKGEKNNE